MIAAGFTVGKLTDAQEKLDEVRSLAFQALLDLERMAGNRAEETPEEIATSVALIGRLRTRVAAAEALEHDLERDIKEVAELIPSRREEP